MTAVAMQPLETGSPLRIVDVSGIAVPSRRARASHRQGVSPLAAAAFAVVVIGGTAIASWAAGTQTRLDPARFAPVAGEFRLSPGNLQPVGLVTGRGVVDPIGFGPVPGEFRLGPGNLEPAGIAGY